MSKLRRPEIRNILRSRPLLVGVVLAAAGVFTSCGGPGLLADDSPIAPTSVVVDGAYSDQRFIDMMVPHHRMAIEMAGDALKNSKDPDIRALSERILRAQANEIEELVRVRQELYGSGRTPDEMHPDVMRNMGMGDHGPGSDSGSGSSGRASSEHGGHQSSTGSSDDFDRRFLDDMLAHHAAAIQHASVALVHSEHKRLRIIAREIVDEQSREVGMMVKWRLDRWEHVL